MRRVATFLAGALVGVALGVIVSGIIYTPMGWMKAHPRPRIAVAPWEPEPDTTRSSDPVDHAVEQFRRAAPEAKRADLDELRRVLRAMTKT